MQNFIGLNAAGSLSNPWAANRVRQRPGPENRNTQIPVDAINKLESVCKFSGCADSRVD